MGAQRDYRAELEKQLGFLERSCTMFDLGHKDEGIRIATVIRTLFHDTGSMTSLVSHLDAQNIRLATSVHESSFDPHTSWLPPGMSRPQPGQQTLLVSVVMGIARFTHIPGQGTAVEYNACTNPQDLVGTRTIPEWWDQIVYVNGFAVKLSRKTLVLTAADKDGGAHVDAELTKEYEAMMRTAESLRYGYRINGEGDLAYIDFRDIHLVYLRQMGFEILNSAELLALLPSKTASRE
jgi:hypothetical protein